MPEGFDPYYKWLGIAPKDQPPNHYRLLGLDLFIHDHDVIENAADRQMLILRTFQTGPQAGHSQRLLNEVAAARNCLLDDVKRSHYDVQLRHAVGGQTAEGRVDSQPPYRAASPSAGAAPPPPVAPVVPAAPMVSAPRGELDLPTAELANPPTSAPLGVAVPQPGVLPSLAAAPVARQKHGGVNHRRRQSPWLFVGLFGGVVVVVLLLLLVVWALSNPDDPPVAGGETGQGGDPAGTQDPAQGGSTGGSIGQVGPAIVVNAIETPSWTTHGDRQWQYGSHGDVITAGVGVELKSWLTSNERYRDFELTAEFLVSEGGAGGVYVWMPTDVQFPWNQAFEIHFRDDFGALTGDESTGAIWQKAIPSSNRSRPMGTWNTTRITCRHGRIRVSINGEEVIDYSIPHNFRAEGHIGLDGVQGGISYRNIRVKRLPQR